MPQTEDKNQPPQLTFDDLAKSVKANDLKVDIDVLKKAFAFATEAHKGQRRRSGEPYVQHPLQTAITLAEMRLDQATLVAGLLHDVPEDTTFNLVEIEKRFGPEVGGLVAGITKLGKIKYRGIERYAENLRKMFISMAQDVRVVLIKMADRLHNLRTIGALPPEKQRRIALEVLEIYAPIANRLGMGRFKGTMEDLAFPIAYPEEWAWFKTHILPQYEVRVQEISSTISELKKVLGANKIKVLDIHGRAKHYYSLYRKLLQPQYNKNLNLVYDLVAIRVVVPTADDCYKAMGAIHTRFTPLPGRIKDYIAQPKPNNYRSLHTTVFADGGKIVEVQLRDQKMHQQAEYGIAAHWHYKEMGKHFWTRISKTQGFHHKGYMVPKKMKWIQELAVWQQEVQDTRQFLKRLKIDAFRDRIFVFTPNGDVIDLPEDATPVDFAYYIHSDIGNTCVGAKINGKLEQLDTQLKNGDVVEIITDKSRKSPGRDWLRFVRTAAARNKIRSTLRHDPEFTRRG
ncbi:MAG: GTP pyrophosphokinase [Parcubacteria group bacterium Gr01-1014_31]|nr:MAG: GTP pyrophosphokinase [Parcubacteria group bacterium Gr01-1014_31]